MNLNLTGRLARVGEDADVGPVLPLLIFEAADCLMALPAAEVTRLIGSGAPADRSPDEAAGVDLTDYFTGRPATGPWIRWMRGGRHNLLRMERVVEVVPCPIRRLTPLPAWLREKRRAGIFWAAGVRGDDVFLLVDPARLEDPPGDGSETRNDERRRGSELGTLRP